jgi:hypothetical protein
MVTGRVKVQGAAGQDVLGSKRDGETGDWRKLHIEELRGQ